MISRQKLLIPQIVDGFPSEKKVFSIKSRTKGSMGFNQGLNGANTTTELCPPNPNEFEMAAN